MNKSELIQDLKEKTKHFIEQAEEWKSLNERTLNWKANEKSWSILECLEHLNLYGDFYLPELEKRILSAPKDCSDRPFKSGQFGALTVTSMLPKNGKLMIKMDAFKDMTPVASELSIATIDRFIRQQKRMLYILDQAQKVSLSKTKTKITLPVIKFKLGTTFRFVIYHNQRHVWQANNVLEKAKA